MFSIRPVTARLLKRVRQRAELFDVADEVVELEPASRFNTAPAICLAGEIDRVTAFVGDEREHRERLAGGIREEGPTRSYRSDDALLADFTLYAAGTYQVYRQGRKRPVIADSADHFDEAQLCTTVCAQMYFGHFFHDSLVLDRASLAHRSRSDCDSRISCYACCS